MSLICMKFCLEIRCDKGKTPLGYRESKLTDTEACYLAMTKILETDNVPRLKGC